MTEDPERLVAEALRAHAARTPLPEPGQVDGTGPVLGGYGLLSGSGTANGMASGTAGGAATGMASGTPLPADDHPTVHVPRPPDRTSRLEPEARVAVGWVVLLALLLGLAAGAVVGLLTLL